ncbi:S-DNA-T family DNA segregation ATPase FtsK/SpoIIIE [Albidovulum inexpectatum]|uniref:DNA translocase FtsK n=1 Tax=Albidovulum inexpectatum TaxID=196587 RepID=A0A2S5JDG8_9RHOB|nr:DNA translocase FtsK [Albidovulum inexpectatum]PPB79471.1 S-DNA-T family DNA segregation ATPase FtsK/SpoIIIE [Albidovulum inexpectatum]
MASYQARQRDPLLDQNIQAALERRGKELIGLILLAAAICVALMLASYSPDDPGWFAATDEPVQNVMGRFGAAIALPLMVVAGKGAWGIALILAAWGLRLVLHRGEQRALTRAIFAPIAVALMSVYASTHVAGPEWQHSFGLGGLFGDTVLAAVLSIVPVQAALGLKIVAVTIAALMVAMTLFVTGFDRAELRSFGRFLLVGTIFGYDAIVRLLGRAISALFGIGKRSATQAPKPATAKAAKAAPTPMTAAPERAEGGLLSRLSGLTTRLRSADPALEPELIEPDQDPRRDLPEAPSEERIRARIADVVRARTVQVTEGEPRVRVEPPLTSAAAAQPRFLRVKGGHAEPPLTARRAAEIDVAAHTELEEPPAMRAEDPVATPRVHQPAPQVRAVVEHPAPKAAQPSRRAMAERQPSLALEEGALDGYEFPPLSLLASPDSVERRPLSEEALQENARMLESVLDDYGVKGEIVSVRPGPVVTMYELEPAPGLKASRVIGLSDDIARSMSALSARVSTVPGRTVIGIELPNAFREKVVLREILSSRAYGDSNMKLPLALGKDISGDPVVANLAKMPHLLIAGTTGSGKSVAINTMILSLLYKLTPDECRLIMIDPKMLELSVYDGIPHLLSPVVTDPKKAVVALKWVVGEMEDRYRKMSKMGVRNIEGYNSRVRDALAKGETFKRTVQTGFDEETGEPVFETEEITPETLPYIVVIVDEMADLMMVAGKEIEACIQRLAQMARASGIHLIMATQRPSVDVITGTIKANFPTRISFQVTSKIDSRTILGEQGAEQLLGQGDMLYMSGGSRITRVHGPFVSDEEVEEVVRHLKSFGPPKYMSGVVEGPDEDKEADIDAVLGLGGNTDGEDALYDQAVQIVLRDRKVSTSYIQRKLGIGYNKAARLVEQMEEQGLISAANHVGKREILVPEQQ